MDKKSVFVKTKEGEDAVRQRTRLVQRNLRNILIMVDGQATLADLAKRFGDENATRTALADLVNSGLIREMEQGIPADDEAADQTDELPVLTAQVEPEPIETPSRPPAHSIPPPVIEEIVLPAPEYESLPPAAPYTLSKPEPQPEPAAGSGWQDKFKALVAGLQGSRSGGARDVALEPIRRDTGLKIGLPLLALISLVGLAVLAGLTFSLSMLVWVLRCGRAALGAPHPGLAWYLAALGCLVLALLAVLAMDGFPEQRAALRLAHLHLNLLGFVGLTALGTLAVLLPTAAGLPDPDAAGWLRRMLPLAASGVLLCAAGAAWWAPLAYLGALLLFLTVARLGTAWLRRFPHALFAAHGAAPSLALALAGLMTLLFLGALHGGKRLSGADAVLAFLSAFLLPLVSGAASQLLPLWLKPGVQSDWHRAARATLGRFAVLRGLTFFAAGWLVALGWRPGAWLAAAALALFAGQLLRVALRR